jgi:hypothetical protein
LGNQAAGADNQSGGNQNETTAPIPHGVNYTSRGENEVIPLFAKHHHRQPLVAQ